MSKIKLKIAGLKCDNLKCDYTDNTKYEEYEKSINKPCPKCGENLLTQEDYDRTVRLKDAIEAKNRLYKHTKIKKVPNSVKLKTVAVLNMHNGITVESIKHKIKNE